MGLSKQKDDQHDIKDRTVVLSALKHISLDSFARLHAICSRLPSPLILGFLSFPTVQSRSIEVRERNHTAAVLADVQPLSLPFHYSAWRGRAYAIRHGQSRTQCIDNLTLALNAFSALRSAETAGSSGALTLLPTAGALIGTPTKELWMVYQLMPLAGVLSMLLSLGGTLVPTNSKDYELTTSAFSYGGMIATAKDDIKEEVDERLSSQMDAHDFANMVEERSKDNTRGRSYVRVWYGIAAQLVLLVLVVFACCFCESGAVIVWWCNSGFWMAFWYLTVATSSVVDNLAGVPFTSQWVLRVSKIPKVKISEDAPVVTCLLDRTATQSTLKNSAHFSESKPLPPAPNMRSPTVRYSRVAEADRPRPVRQPTEVLAALDRGYDYKGQVSIEANEPWSAPLSPFYVIISLQGISHLHALTRVASKAFSVGVFALGTSMFAAAQFITIFVALTVLILVLSVGVFGRVIAMWMASEMVKSRPVLHRVVKTRQEAAECIDRILEIDGIAVEVKGHIIVQGRCIQKYSRWLAPSSWLGVLAQPFNVRKMAVS